MLLLEFRMWLLKVTAFVTVYFQCVEFHRQLDVQSISSLNILCIQYVAAKVCKVNAMRQSGFVIMGIYYAFQSVGATIVLFIRVSECWIPECWIKILDWFSAGYLVFNTNDPITFIFHAFLLKLSKKELWDEEKKFL